MQVKSGFILPKCECVLNSTIPPSENAQSSVGWDLLLNQWLFTVQSWVVFDHGTVGIQVCPAFSGTWDVLSICIRLLPGSILHRYG